MLFQPSNIYPSTFSGIGAGTVDVTQGLSVSWQVNGDTPMTAYEIKIYQNDTASTLLYDSGSLAVSPAFEPHDKNGNPAFFTTLISASALASAGIVNGYQYGYKMLITQYWSASDYVEQTSASVFITRSTPTLSIDTIPNPVDTNSLTITATYAQAQGDPISTVEWIFALAGSEDTPIKRTGAVSTQILSFDADGLITGNTYSVMCNVVTSTGMEATTGYVQFSVSYPSSSLEIDYTLAQLKNSSAAYLSWEGLGSNILSYPYTDSTKTTNGITFTVSGEGKISVSGTATADALFTVAQGTLAQIGISAGQKILVTSGYSGSIIQVDEINGSNVTVSTVSGSTPLQYIVPQTDSTLKFSIVIPSGTTLSAQAIQPMLYIENDIKGVDDLSVTMTPIQDLHGYANPWPAGGGVNIWDEQWELGSINSRGEPSGSSTSIRCKNFIPVVPGNTYRYVNGSGINQAPWLYDENQGFIQRYGSYMASGTTITIPEGCYYIKFALPGSYGATYKNDIAWNYPATVTTYSPYSNICPISGRTGLSVYVSPTQDTDDATVYNVDWTTQAGTVYGGTVDVVTGLLTVTHAISTITETVNGSIVYSRFVLGAFGILDAKKPSYCNILTRHSGSASGIGINQYLVLNSGGYNAAQVNIKLVANQSSETAMRNANNAILAQWAAEGHPLQIVWGLATPLTYQLTGQEIALLTQNNVWSDSDDVTLTYKRQDGTQNTLSGDIVSFSDSAAVEISTPQYQPVIEDVAVYRYTQGEPILRRVFDFADGTSNLLDYFAPSQSPISYVIAARGADDTLFIQTSQFTPVFWFYSVLLCDTDSDGIYHVAKEFVFKYGVESGAVSNNNNPTLQLNFTHYPNRQPISSLYKTGKVTGYIGTVSGAKLYSDSISLQNAIYEISTSTLTKFLKTRKGDVLMVDTASPIQMKTDDATTQQALKATIEWAEIGDATDVSIVSVPTDSFWPIKQ